MTIAPTDPKIFGVGLSRTGTTSLTAALELLGIRSIHYPSDAVTHAELREGRFRLSVLESHQAALDTPVAAFFRQLDRTYPESKFILTLRDKASWLRSCESFWSSTPTASQHDDDFRGFIRQAVYGCLEFDPERFARIYDRHTDAVTRHFSDRPGRLLIMDIVAGDGWEVLCPFLDRSIPEDPFPHLNDKVENERWNRARARAIEELGSAVGSGEGCVLVDDQTLGPVHVGGTSVLPFLERDGRYQGRPSDGNQAIAELERLRRHGAHHIALAWPAFWWLDTYADFGRYLRNRFRLVTETDRIIVFDLREGRSPP